MRAWKLIAEERFAEIVRLREENEKLMDRLQAASLTEYKSHHGGFAMPEPEPEDDDVWATDFTGIVRDKLPELTSADRADFEARKAAGMLD